MLGNKRENVCIVKSSFFSPTQNLSFYVDKIILRASVFELRRFRDPSFRDRFLPVRFPQIPGRESHHLANRRRRCIVGPHTGNTKPEVFILILQVQCHVFEIGGGGPHLHC